MEPIIKNWNGTYGSWTRCGFGNTTTSHFGLQIWTEVNKGWDYRFDLIFRNGIFPACLVLANYENNTAKCMVVKSGEELQNISNKIIDGTLDIAKEFNRTIKAVCVWKSKEEMDKIVNEKENIMFANELYEDNHYIVYTLV